MSLVAVASAKSSPGASVVAELLALLWPVAPRRALLDCDPAGSSWVLRPGVVPGTGLVGLATDARRELRAELVVDHLQSVGDLYVLVGPPAARQAHAALASVGPDLGGAVRQVVDVAVADCGRLQPATPAYGLCQAADRVVLVCRPTAAGVVHLAPWVEQLRSDGCPVATVLTALPPRATEATYGEGEVADALGVPVLGTVAHDPGAAAALRDRPGQLSRTARSPLVRSMKSIAAHLAAELTSPVPDAAGIGDPAARSLATATRTGTT